MKALDGWIALNEFKADTDKGFDPGHKVKATLAAIRPNPLPTTEQAPDSQHQPRCPISFRDIGLADPDVQNET